MAAEQLDGALDALTEDDEPSVDAVHDVRKHMKKLRALVRLARPGLGDEVVDAENEAYRDVGRALGALRDADALGETVDRLAAAFGSPRHQAAVERIRGLIDGEGATRAPGEAARVAAGATEALVLARRRVEEWPVLDDRWSSFGGGVEREYRRGRRALAALGPQPSIEAMHTWRKRVKDHWYHLRLTRDAWVPVMRALEAQACRLADLLGDEHDLAVLHTTLIGDGDGPAAGDTAVAYLIAMERARLRSEALAIGVPLYAEAPAAVAARMGAWWERPAARRRQAA